MTSMRTLALLAVAVTLCSCGDKALRYYNRGLDAMEENDVPAAIDYFQKSIELRDDPDAYVNLGVAYHRAGKYQEALGALKKALTHYPEDPVLRYNIAETYRALQSWGSAQREYELAIRLRTDFYEALTALGSLMLELGQLEEAEQNLVHAITIKPTYNPAYVYLGELYATTGKLHQATFYLYRALKNDPGSVNARLSLALVFYKRRLYSDAIEQYEEVQLRDESNGQALLGLGRCYLDTGHPRQAKHFFESALDTRTNFPEAHKGLGDVYFVENEYAAALANYRMAIQQRADYPEAYIGMGLLHAATDNFDEALDAYEQALYRSPGHPWALYHMGRLYQELGKLEQAHSYLDKALENAGEDSEVRSLAREALRELQKAQKESG